jgi:signal transduction histidine kinase
LGDEWEVLWDPSGALTLADVAGPEFRNAFVRPRWNGSAGFSDSVLWVRFAVTRPPGAPDDWVLVLGVPYLTEVLVHGPVADGLVRLGNSVPLVDRPLRTSDLAVPLVLGEGETATVHLRIRSHGALNLWGEIVRMDDAILGFEQRGLLEGALLGGLLVTLVLNLVVGLWMRDGLVLIYASYLAGLFLLFLGVTGAVSILFPTLGGLTPSMLCGFGSLVNIPAGLMLWVLLLRIRAWNRVLWGLYLAVSLVTLAALTTLGTPLYGKVAPVVFLTAVAMSILSLILALVARPLGHRLEAGSWFIGGLAVMAVAATVTVGASVGILPATVLTTQSYIIGAVVHAILVNIGLAGRLRALARDRSKAEQRAVFESRRGEEQRQFIAMLVHEFRSPLAAMDRAARLITLKGGALDGGSIERLGRIRGLVERLSALVDSFLASEALEHGGLSLDRRRATLVSLLGDVRRTLEEGTTRLKLHVDPPDLAWDLDREMAATAIGNVVSNALKYSGDAPVVVEAFEDSRGMLRVVVTDRGPGLTAEDQARMGDLYYRGAAAKGTRGTGLGLTITRKVMAAHGGGVTFSPGPDGRGTRVTLDFGPALDDDDLFQ